MKSISRSFAFVTLVLSLSVPAQSGWIQTRLNVTRAAVAKNPERPESYNELAIALVRQARQTGDSQYCEEADRAVHSSLRLAPGKFESRKAVVVVHLCEKRWKEALEEATALNKQTPDDNPTWGYLADAQIALGNYEAAEKATQWMIDMRQVNPQALQRGARLRELFGYNDAAIEWWGSSLRLTSVEDTEERAWILTRMARVQTMLGRFDAARASVEQALALETGYPAALEAEGRLAAAQGKWPEAIRAFQKRLALGSSLSTLFDLGKACEVAGNHEEAKTAFAAFEKGAVARTGAPDHDNADLVRYYAEVARQPKEALRVAEAAASKAPTVEILFAYAMALEADGNHNAAFEKMQLALRSGVKNPEWLVSAGELARRADQNERALAYFKQAIEAGPSSPAGDRAIQLLTRREHEGPAGKS